MAATKEYLRKYRKETKVEMSTKGRVVRAFMTTEIRKNPYYSKFVIDTLIDARDKWAENEKMAQLEDKEYKLKPCPLTSESIRWVSEYLNFLYISRNGNPH